MTENISYPTPSGPLQDWKKSQSIQKGRLMEVFENHSVWKHRIYAEITHFRYRSETYCEHKLVETRADYSIESKGVVRHLYWKFQLHEPGFCRVLCDNILDRSANDFQWRCWCYMYVFTLILTFSVIFHTDIVSGKSVWLICINILVRCAGKFLSREKLVRSVSGQVKSSHGARLGIGMVYFCDPVSPDFSV